MKDRMLESLRDKKEYSNTVSVTKFYDGIDLTIDQSFKDQREEVENPHNRSWISFRDAEDLLLSPYARSDEQDEIQNNRFFLEEKFEQSEYAMYLKYGCECCGKKLILPIEKSFGICIECDRIMFSRSRARKAFEELPDYATCVCEDLYQPLTNDERLNILSERNEKGIWKFIMTFVGRKKKNPNRLRWHPFYREIVN